MEGVTAGVPVLHRTEKLEAFLESVEDVGIRNVIVADNGHTDERSALYSWDWAFDLEVIDLDHNVGIGKCRRAIVDRLSTDKLLVADCDMRIPSDIHVLDEILETEESFGGVGAILAEHGYLRAGCTDLFEENLYTGKALVQEVRGHPTIDEIRGYPVAVFDKIANAMIVRSDCLADYSWDPNLEEVSHLDFFRGQMETEWEFGVCPSVVMWHDRGEIDDYRATYRVSSRDRKNINRQRFCDKWGYDRIVTGDSIWYSTYPLSTLERLSKVGHRTLPTKYFLPIKDFGQRIFL